MEPLPIMLFSFMFGFPLYRIVPLPAILVDIALFAVISIWVLPAALQVSSSVSRPNALILLLPALLIFIFSVLGLIFNKKIYKWLNTIKQKRKNKKEVQNHENH